MVSLWPTGSSPAFSTCSSASVFFSGFFPFPFCTLFPNLVVCIVGFFYSSWLVGMKTTTKVNENHQFCYFFAQIFVALRFLENDERAP